MKLFKHIIILLFFTACTSNENKQDNIPIKNSHDSSKINVKTSPIKETSKPKKIQVDTLLTEPNYVDSIPYLVEGFHYWKDLYRNLGFSHLYDGKDSNCRGSLRKYPGMRLLRLRLSGYLPFVKNRQKNLSFILVEINLSHLLVGGRKSLVPPTTQLMAAFVL